MDRSDFIYVVYLILPLRLFLQLGRALGWLEMLVRPRARREVRRNLDQAFAETKSPRQRARLTRQVFEYHQMRTLMLIVAPLMAARGQLERWFPLRGVANLDHALAAGKGVVLLGSHLNSIGTFLAAMQLRRLGYDVRCPLPAEGDPWPTTRFRRAVNRVFKAVPVVEAVGGFYAQFNVRPLMRLLAEGAILVHIGDGWHSASFVDVEFLGRRLPFTNGPENLARLAGAPIVPIFAVGTPDQLRFEIEQPFRIDRAAPQELEIARAVTQFIHRVEQRMLANVPCWQHWMEDDLFGRLEGWRDRPIKDRYEI